ncbi:potassium transporter Kup [Roseococcus thiosulfatophilus]|uniref:potassium transporter Kup n=1 Tax=Roseococcus thiosulfatophilus TaxID=35813 RepID=UPI001A8E5CD0|nr:potassium transporter Kup [Roseococcus thiosulfatophilus]
MTPAHAHGHARGALTAASVLAVLGIVYGDIGTSPLYAMRASLLLLSGGGVIAADVLGILSLIFWSLILVVTVKYVGFILRADNRGEGGIISLTALALRALPEGSRLRRVAVLVGIAGASLFFSDGMVTPAISVLSAIEGLQVVSPAMEPAVIPLAIAVLIGLFLAQSRGTGSMGRIFGPVTALWFAVLAVLGLVQVVQNPAVLVATSPAHAWHFLLDHPLASFIALGAVVLAVTGGEALYADMGHFGARPIRFAWLFIVLPSLLINYFGQGALLLADPSAIANPFFLLAPEILRLPLVLLATLATIIASQAMISGAFSVARQCVQMGLLPRLEVRHTSATEEGQIYLPQVNFLLLVGVLLLVVTFRSSDALAAAYGIAVTGTFVCTSLLAIIVFWKHFRWPLWIALPVFSAFLLIDATFFAANLLKVPDGGYFPVLLGTALFLLMTTWQRGRDLLFARFRQDGLPLRSFIARLPQSRTLRVPGIAVFMTSQAEYLPGALLHNLKHNKVLHENVLFVTVTNESIPHVGPERRREVEELAPGIHRVSLHYGFQESPNIPRELESLRELGIPFEPMQTSYFLGRETIVAAAVPRLSGWRQWLFTLMSRNAVPATEFFRIPSDRVVELGVRVAI